VEKKSIFSYELLRSRFQCIYIFNFHNSPCDPIFIFILFHFPHTLSSLRFHGDGGKQKQDGKCLAARYIQRYIRIVVVVVIAVAVAIIMFKTRPVAGDVVTRFYNKLSK
jgi:hypothetical protein